MELPPWHSRGRVLLRHAAGASRRTPGDNCVGRAALLARRVFGNKVIDRERIVGVSEQPIDAAAVYEVNADGLIAAVWFFNAD